MPILTLLALILMLILDLACSFRWSQSVSSGLRRRQSPWAVPVEILSFVLFFCSLGFGLLVVLLWAIPFQR